MTTEEKARGSGCFGRVTAGREDCQSHGHDCQRWYISQKVTMLGGGVDGLHSHDPSVDNAGPNGEPNQTAVLQRVPRSKEKKYSESGIDAENHLLVMKLIGLPAPSRRPKGHHERVNAEYENQANENQDNAEIAQPCSIVHV